MRHKNKPLLLPPMQHRQQQTRPLKQQMLPLPPTNQLIELQSRINAIRLKSNNSFKPTPLRGAA